MKVCNALYLFLCTNTALEYDLFTIVSIAIFRQDPAEYPPIFEAPRHVLSRRYLELQMAPALWVRQCHTQMTALLRIWASGVHLRYVLRIGSILQRRRDHAQRQRRDVVRVALVWDDGMLSRTCLRRSQMQYRRVEGVAVDDVVIAGVGVGEPDGQDVFVRADIHIYKFQRVGQ